VILKLAAKRFRLTPALAHKVEIPPELGAMLALDENLASQIPALGIVHLDVASALELGVALLQGQEGSHRNERAP